MSEPIDLNLAYSLAGLKRAADNGYAWSVYPAEAAALLAEIERLRAINTDLRLMVDGLETAAHEERAAVVAWLRKRQEAAEWALMAAGYEHAADTIERGEHRRKEGK